MNEVSSVSIQNTNAKKKTNNSQTENVLYSMKHLHLVVQCVPRKKK